jgi:hypothetical protein
MAIESTGQLSDSDCAKVLMVAEVDRRRESRLDGWEKHEAWTVAQQICSRADRVPRGRRAATSKRKLVIDDMSYETLSSR